MEGGGWVKGCKIIASNENIRTHFMRIGGRKVRCRGDGWSERNSNVYDEWLSIGHHLLLVKKLKCEVTAAMTELMDFMYLVPPLQIVLKILFMGWTRVSLKLLRWWQNSCYNTVFPTDDVAGA